ncbi:MAG: GH25 family lysozyme [Eubacteriales bacterium]|nr:GH25 family lysozyme [Eubacteriales bacterium]
MSEFENDPLSENSDKVSAEICDSIIDEKTLLQEDLLTEEKTPDSEGETPTTVEEKPDEEENPCSLNPKTPKNRRKPGKKGKGYLIVIALLLVINLVLSICLCVKSLKLSRRENYTNNYTGPVTVEGEMIPLYNSELGETYIPAIPHIPKADYDIDNIREENGYRYYYEDGEVSSLVGIDVSTYNGSIDFGAVKKSGVDFVMVRIGGRGYGESGALYEDDMCRENLKNAREAGLLVGGYFFSQARNEEEAIEEAEYSHDILSSFELDFPLAYDWEILSGTATRIDGVSPETATLCARAFCDRVIELGYTPMVYTNEQLGYYKLNLGTLKDIDIWYAGYSSKPYFYYNYTMWQYSASGEVPGVKGHTDLNICFKDYSKE